MFSYMFKALSVICKQKGVAEENKIRKVIHVYMMNKRGPKILPCGTPDSTGSRQELLLFIVTY